MTVAQLIALLQSMPQDSEIRIQHPVMQGNNRILEVNIPNIADPVVEIVGDFL